MNFEKLLYKRRKVGNVRDDVKLILTEDVQVEVPPYTYTNFKGKVVKVPGFSYERGEGGKKINKQPLVSKTKTELQKLQNEFDRLLDDQNKLKDRGGYVMRTAIDQLSELDWNDESKENILKAESLLKLLETGIMIRYEKEMKEKDIDAWFDIKDEQALIYIVEKDAEHRIIIQKELDDELEKRKILNVDIKEGRNKVKEATTENIWELKRSLEDDIESRKYHQITIDRLRMIQELELPHNFDFHYSTHHQLSWSKRSYEGQQNYEWMKHHLHDYLEIPPRYRGEFASKVEFTNDLYKKSYLGQFFRNEDIVAISTTKRSRDYEQRNKLSTMAHEVGHHIHLKTWTGTERSEWDEIYRNRRTKNSSNSRIKRGYHSRNDMEFFAVLYAEHLTGVGRIEGHSLRILEPAAYNYMTHKLGMKGYDNPESLGEVSELEKFEFERGNLL